MRGVVQRVARAEVRVEGRTVGSIGPGMLVFVGVGEGDTAEQADRLAGKLARLRIFVDDEGRMNRSVLAWICDMNGRIPADTSDGSTLLRNVCSTQKIREPINGPKTVAAPPSSRAV